MQIGYRKHAGYRFGRSKVARLLIAAAIAPAIFGCGNTLNGAKQDVATDAQKASESTQVIADKTTAAARVAGQAIKSVPENAGAAVTVTPEVKVAIVRDPVLNDPKNLINVQSRDHETHLTGHVLTDRMKQRAEEDAQDAIAKRHPDYRVVNDLVVQASP